MKLKISLRQRISESVKQKAKIALAAAMGGFTIVTFIVFFTYNNVGIKATAIAAPGKDGSRTITNNNVVLNEYTSLTADAVAGVSNIMVANAYLNSNGRFASNLSPGDLVMIIQVEGACKDVSNDSSLSTLHTYNNEGNFEFAEVLNVTSSTKIILKSRIAKSYSSDGKVQVIRVPRYSTLNISTSGFITAPAWNGTTGGIVAMEVNQHTMLNGSVNVDGKGFSGDQEKNREMDYTAEKIFMGAGGCESVETSETKRVQGGGLVYLISGGTVSGTGTISANGANGVTGDGGEGGTVVIYSKGKISDITINAKGGAGVNKNFTGSDGSIFISHLTGAAKNDPVCTNGTIKGFNGKNGLTPTFPYSSGANLQVELIRFNGEAIDNKTLLTWATSAEINNDYFTIEKSTDGITFNPYGKIEGAGNTTVVQNYSFEDLHPSAGLNYYRLKQTDSHGKIEYFKIIKIDFREAS